MCTLLSTLSIGFYFTQDYAYRDIDGDYQIQGRKDDIIRVKGVWLQVPEIESNIVSNLSHIYVYVAHDLCVLLLHVG